MEKFADHMEHFANGVTDSFHKIEEAIINGYKQIEDAFVDTFLAKKRESVEEAKSRMYAEREKLEAEQKANIEKSLKASRNAGKTN